MDAKSSDGIPADLIPVAERLRRERPGASELELDEIKLTVKRRASRTAPGLVMLTKGVLMKSRLALTTVLVLGILFSGTGATLAVSGFSDDGSAGTAQYQLPSGGSGDPGEIGDPGISGDPVVVAEADQQVAAQGGGELPLTGFLAIPLVIGGVVLLTTGVVIRRKARD